MKLSVFTVATPDMTPEQLAAAAGRAGLNGIEWRYKEVPEGAETDPPSFWGNNRCSISPFAGPQEWDRFKKAAAEHGMETLSVTPYLRIDDLAATEHVLRAAHYLGARFIRLGVPSYDRSIPFNRLYEAGLAYLKQAESLCRKYGVKGLIETHHGTIAASASGAMRLVQELDPDAVGVLYDPGNMVFEGFENYRMGMEMLGPYLAHVHVKNAGWQTTGAEGEDGALAWTAGWEPMKQGMVPWKQVIDDLRAVGYDGYLGLEDFSGEFGSEPMMKAFADYMRRL
jgi:sugar phosphate isomerase/epimerase